MREALAAELDWLDRRIAREALRLRARYQLSLDEFRGLLVSDEQVDAHLAFGERAAEPAEPAPLPAPRPDGALALVCRRFGLGDTERGALVLALAPELDCKYEPLFAYLNDDVARRWPTSDLAARLLDAPFEARAALLDDAALTRSGLISTVAEPAARTQLSRGFSASAALARFVLGLPPELAPGLSFAEPDNAGCGPLEPALDLFCAGARPPALALVGEAGSGRLRAATAFAARLGRPLLVADLAIAERPSATLRKAALAARLAAAAVFVDGLDQTAAADPNERRALAAALADLAGPTLIAVDSSLTALDGIDGLDLAEVVFPEPGPGDRRAVWTASLAEAGASARTADVAAVADRFRLGKTAIRRASRSVAAAGLLARRDRAEAPLAALCHAAAAESGKALRRLATAVPQRFGWPDLVLPPETLKRVRAASDAIANRARVQEEWGLGRISGAGGLTMLFQGPSGVGKTMTASVVARTIGFDLYRIELSGVVSKYIGETEKNLERIFAAARRSNAMLLFDEADALFGKRSDVKDAHDRYANLEVAYLLQRMEEHDGVTILATNLSRNMDQAFSRRLNHIVEFPRPDAAARLALWTGMLRPPLPCAQDIDLPALAAVFDLTGGEIRKAVLEAAYLAAAEGGCVTMAGLAGSAARECRRQGRMVTEPLGIPTFAVQNVA